MKYKDSLGNWVSIALPSFDGIPIGTIVEYAGSVLPKGYLFCDGTSISRIDYADLFNKIGTAYGNGDGSTTFNLPNFKGRIPVGYDVAQEEFNELGKIGGSKELQSHTHLLKMAGDSNIGGNAPFADYHYIIQSPDINIYTNGWVSNSGNGNSGNIQPYQVVNYIIKAKQTTPTSAQIIDEYGTSTTDGYSQKYCNNSFGGTILWTNSNPTSDFSNQDISINNISEYDILEVIYYASTSNLKTKTSKFINKSGQGTMIDWLDTARGATWYRMLTIGTNKISVSICTNNATSTTDTSDCIPLHIIGYKTKLFD